MIPSTKYIKKYFIDDYQANHPRDAEGGAVSGLWHCKGIAPCLTTERLDPKWLAVATGVGANLANGEYGWKGVFFAALAARFPGAFCVAGEAERWQIRQTGGILNQVVAKKFANPPCFRVSAYSS